MGNGGISMSIIAWIVLGAIAGYLAGFSRMIVVRRA